ncbi:hypothetical protein [Azospirillum sp.]|uniref:hypothetical protein n=1 Tax=Azospirillum sp. TaxID=34012 RepID=UPI003D72144C
MPRRFVIAPLSAAHIDQAFPVVQPLRPGFTPAQWRALAAPFTETGDTRGVIACRMGTGHIRGLFCYALDETGVLRVGPFAVAGLFDAPATADGLIEAAGQLAHRLGAGRIVVDRGALAVIAVPHCDLVELFAHRGYRLEGDALVGEGAVSAPVAATA